jgi:hypothetical protein
MTDKEIIRMAREEGIHDPWIKSEQVKRFAARVAALVAEAEREACAFVADEHTEDCYDGDSDWYKCRSIAAAIRSRGTT